MTVRTKRATLATTECAVLGLLARGPMSGYDLKKAIERSVGYFWGPAKSQIYAVLPRLVEAGYATSRRVTQSQRPDKKVYRITPRGRQAVTEWIERSPGPPSPDRNPLLLKIFFGDLSSPEVLLEQIRERRREAEQLKDELDAIEEKTAAGSQDFYPALTRKYGYRYADAIIRWAAAAERDLMRRSSK